MGERHILKTWPTYFQSVLSGEKTFEVRRDDRGFQKGDIVVLAEFDPAVPQAFGFTGRQVARRISYVLTGGQFGIEPGFVVLALTLTTTEPS